MKKSNTVFIVSLIISLIFIAPGIIAPKQFAEKATAVQNFLQDKFGWFYLLSATAFLVFVLFLAFSKFGRIRLGDPDDRPEYSTITWFAMLFSAGMGIGLVFWGVAEPISHYFTPPSGEAASPQAAQNALRYSFFHWGLHPWGIYTLIGLSLAYFKFRKNAPGLISAIFTPLIGDRVNGPIGKTIDVIAVFATVFGVATSLGLGAIQISGGISYLTDVSNNFQTQFIIIIIVTFLFMFSAQTGLDKGIKYLSNTNIILAILLMVALLFAGPTNFIMDAFVQSLGSYLQFLPSMSFNLSTFNPENSSWIQSWTVFYWAWWIAWAPFVGTFIARVSKGRTIREFIIGVLLVPTIFGALWFSVFGGTAINLEMFHDFHINDIINKEGSEVALFAMLGHLPLGNVMSVIAILLIATFFITSADSATFVLGMQTSNGSLYPPNKIKFVWGIVQAATAAVLLWSGGLQGLQTAAIIAAFPFAFILIAMMFSMVKTLREELASIRKSEQKR
ncbi:glycine betaine uptake BCCT transporter [Fictibacillus enclensis]|uniref:glycine betaine uptake BCCT transporter n=1 Tax=Fictibacillus enclensis TaxID=1017270 RepID=UPI0024BF38CD|nr:BCCT family transporter [Fictibacillus enclensis]WHY74934.1 BCCT family transporter [Fictibacillus enclensis]